MLVVVLGAKTEGNPHIPWTQRSKQKGTEDVMFCIPTYTHGAEVRTCNKIEYITHVCIHRIYIMLMLMLNTTTILCYVPLPCR